MTTIDTVAALYLCNAVERPYYWFPYGFEGDENMSVYHELYPGAFRQVSDVANEIKKLLKSYNSTKEKTLEEIIDFHCKFERIHPFQDGNGRVGRLIMFKECLRNGLTPFIIEDDIKEYYYRGLKEWNHEKGYLTDTILTCQDRFKAYMDYFGVKYYD